MAHSVALVRRTELREAIAVCHLNNDQCHRAGIVLIEAYAAALTFEKTKAPASLAYCELCVNERQAYRTQRPSMTFAYTAPRRAVLARLAAARSSE